MEADLLFILGQGVTVMLDPQDDDGPFRILLNPTGRIMDWIPVTGTNLPTAVQRAADWVRKETT